MNNNCLQLSVVLIDHVTTVHLAFRGVNRHLDSNFVADVYLVLNWKRSFSSLQHDGYTRFEVFKC